MEWTGAFSGADHGSCHPSGKDWPRKPRSWQSRRSPGHRHWRSVLLLGSMVLVDHRGSCQGAFSGLSLVVGGTGFWQAMLFHSLNKSSKCTLGVHWQTCFEGQRLLQFAFLLRRFHGHKWLREWVWGKGSANVPCFTWESMVSMAVYG